MGDFKGCTYKRNHSNVLFNHNSHLSLDLSENPSCSIDFNVILKRANCCELTFVLSIHQGVVCEL